jgi:hypothetical protein
MMKISTANKTLHLVIPTGVFWFVKRRTTESRNVTILQSVSILISIVASTAFAPQLAHAAEPIGRLFTSSNERSNLDYLRQTKKNEPLKVESPTLEADAPPPVILPDAVNLQGYVKRNDGKQSTVWVNNQAMTENSRNKDVTVGKLAAGSNRVPIKLSANGKRLNLKAGQVYDPESNRVQEARNHGAQGDGEKMGGRLDGTIDDNGL